MSNVGVALEVPHFASSVYKSTKHLGLSLPYDAQKIWNDLHDDVCSVTSLSLFRKKLTTYLFTKAYPLRAVGVLFSPMMSGWAGGRREKFVRPVSQKP